LTGDGVNSYKSSRKGPADQQAAGDPLDGVHNALSQMRVEERIDCPRGQIDFGQSTLRSASHGIEGSTDIEG
jgi:hypothetical protein